jgi:hypothetical protein
MESDQTAPLLDPEERYAAAFAPLEDQFMDVLRELDHMEAGGSQHEPEVGRGRQGQGVGKAAPTAALRGLSSILSTHSIVLQ